MDYTVDPDIKSILINLSQQPALFKYSAACHAEIFVVLQGVIAEHFPLRVFEPPCSMQVWRSVSLYAPAYISR